MTTNPSAREVDRLRLVLSDIHSRAGSFMNLGPCDFSYEDTSERLGLALQDLSVIRRKAAAALSLGAPSGSSVAPVSGFGGSQEAGT